MEQPSDIELVTMARTARDESAFAALVRRHQARLRAFLTRLCGDASLADDIAQDAFLKAHAGLQGFRGGSSFRSWLYVIAYREFLQSRRRQAAARKLEDALTAEAERQGEAAQGQDPGLSIDLRRALMSLEEPERAAILLCDAAGLSHTEAAAALGAPLGSIKTYVSRARDKMRASLASRALTCPASKPNTAIKGVSYAL